MKPPSATMTAGALGCMVVVVSFAAGLSHTAVLINETPSLPRGIYLRTSAAQTPAGAIVAIAQPAEARSYLAGLGVPAEMWILKRVAAGGGDAVCAGEEVLSAPGRRVQVLRRDRQGRPLPIWQDCRVLGADELFLLGDTQASFDSRYFGPVRAAAVQGSYRRVLGW
jgi:conjugative transfer signal peptidase TraF